VAVLIPEDISATAVPPGERKFHSFLKILFESRPDVTGWHSVRVCGKEIDFALLLPGEETKTSPYVQARECGYRVLEEIQREPLLCRSGEPHKGKPIIPVGHVVVFANIPRKKAQAGPHAARLDPQATLFEEDLANDGPYLANPKDGLKTFLEFARRALQVTFPAPALSGPQNEALKKKVFADSVIRMADSTRRRQSRKVGEVAMAS
jgi:DNA-directed RNA polymerase subunit RPC12/RpoP